MRIFRSRLKKTARGERIHPKLDWLNITPEAGNFTFGYYDRNPFSIDNRYHLAVRFEQQKAIPEPGETAMVGIIDIPERTFKPVAETQAWCHQQGAMTQWLPNKPGQFIFNDFKRDNSGNWKPISRVYNLRGNHIKDYEHPVYVLSHDGKYAATLDFSRIPRRGYSYARAPKPDDSNVPDPDSNGLFIMNMETGKRRLALSYREILSHPDGSFSCSNLMHNPSHGYYHWMNHAVFNCDDSRVMVLHRYQKSLGDWKTDLWSCRLDGTDAICSFDHEWWSNWGVSHQMWGRSPREILVDGKRGRFSYPKYWVFDEIGGPAGATLVSRGTRHSGHLNFSPNFRWLLGDTYPHRRTQYLSVTRLPSNKAKIIGSFYHSPKQRGDYRCDLHPRWSADGRYISVDSIHLGTRNIFILEADEIMSKIYGN